MAHSKLTIIANLKLVAATTSSLHDSGHGQLSGRLVNGQASGQAEIRVDLVVDGAGHVVVEGGLDGGGQGAFLVVEGHLVGLEAHGAEIQGGLEAEVEGHLGDHGHQVEVQGVAEVGAQVEVQVVVGVVDLELLGLG